MDETKKGRSVIVTGGGRGIARRVCMDFASRGDRVAVVDLVEERARSTGDEITKGGGTAIALACDVRSEPSVESAVGRVVEAFGGVDVLVNAAGAYTPMIASHELAVDDWDLVIDSNLKGCFLLAKVCIPHMMKGGGGRIVNFGSNAARTSSPALGCHYTAAKTAILGLTRHLAKEYAGQNILVNTLSPGPAWVDRNREILTDEQAAKLKADIPLGRFATPEDISDVVLFLASHAARYITGATIDVNGGYVMV